MASASEYKEQDAVSVMARNMDEELLAELGYKQEFRREFNVWSTSAFAFSIMGVLASFSSTLSYPLQYGGHVGMIWGWGLASFFVMFVALSMAELCSAMPTSGGLYYWCAKLAPPKWSAAACWITGWANVTGQVALVCSIDYTCAQMITTAVSVSTDGQTNLGVGPTYGILVALLTAHGLLCSSATRILANLNLVYVLINLSGVIATIACLAALGPKQPASEAFGKFENNSGWENNGFAFLLSITAAMWSLTGYDSAAHIAEETANATKVGPIAIISAVSGTATLGWVLSIVTSFVTPCATELLDSPLPLPMGQVYYNVLGKHGMLAIWSFVIIIQFNTAAAQAVDASRVVYALARDRALPFSGLLARVNTFTQTPVNAVWSVCICSGLLGLLTLQETAGLALFSCAVIALYVSYAVPIFFRITSGRSSFRPGAWSLGRLGVPIGCVAVFWVTFVVVILLFPPNPSLSLADMNWACVILGFVLLSSSAWWMLSARKWFTGPISNVSGQDEAGLPFPSSIPGASGRSGGSGSDPNSSTLGNDNDAEKVGNETENGEDKFGKEMSEEGRRAMAQKASWVLEPYTHNYDRQGRPTSRRVAAW